MKYIVFISLTALAAIACNPDKTSRVDNNTAKFTTSDASELFFRNVRQLYYDKTTMEEAKLDVYRLKDRKTAAGQPVINLSIVINWRYDEAYLLTEPNEYLQALDSVSILWKDTVSQEEGTLFYKPGNKEEHFTFAVQIYQHIQQEHHLYLLTTDGKQEKFLGDRQSREAFRKTTFDYFRLVDLL